MVLTHFQALHYTILCMEGVYWRIISSLLRADQGLGSPFHRSSVPQTHGAASPGIFSTSTPQVQSICTIRVGVHTSQIAQYGIIPMTGYYSTLLYLAWSSGGSCNLEVHDRESEVE